MKPIKYYFLCSLLLIVIGISSCKKQLDVQNPNQPTLADAETETGIISLAKGAVYTNGFNGVSLTGLNWLGNSFFSLSYGYQELLADVISATASNQNINVIGLPEYVILDNGTKISSTASQRSLIRTANARSARTSNAFYYEWGYMYSLNNSCNNLLNLLPNVTFSGDTTAKANAIKAWAYWWKGYAYSRIGSLYYSGLINNDIFATNAHYVIHDSIIAEANKNLDEAASIVNSVTNTADFSAILGQLIPEFTQTGNGGVLSQSMWIHNINTLKARNLLVNKKASDMTTADWTSLLTLTNAGIASTDKVFTARTAETNGFMSASNGSVAAMTTGTSSTFGITERFIQEYKTGDKRLENNFSLRASPVLNQTGGFTYSTRWLLVDGGNGLANVNVLSNKIAGSYELFIAGSYEENALMQAEALINTGQTDQGLALVDAVRTYQGAGIAPVSATGLSLEASKEELRRERRVALVFQGISFYDARRWGVIYDVSKGGGRTGAVVINSTGEISTNATINYNFLDYWDVPADEIELNPADASSTAVKNPE